MAIRGLYNFIKEIRDCTTPEQENERIQEELAKIRNKFSGGLNEYNRKKYMWKLLYIHTLGYKIETGHRQATEFLHDSRFSVKQVGYLAVSLLLIEDEDILRMCLQSIRKDLSSENEFSICLALALVANVAIPEFAPSLIQDVQRLLTDPRSAVSVRKKACLCMLRLIRQNPDCIPVDAKPIGDIINLCGDRNEGVLTTLLSLLIGLSKIDPDSYEPAVVRVIDILERYVLNEGISTPRSYIYYKTPVPWLQVKCLRFLQFFPPPVQTGKLQRILRRILQQTEVTTSLNKNNADHAILFEAINVIIHLNVNGEEMLHQEAMNYLFKFIAVKEPNIRYLGLEAMTRLAKIRDTQDSIQKNLKTIQYSLDDDDISVRRRALDLLYGIANQKNAEEIVEVLLATLKKCEHVMKEEVVVKIAIIGEKHSPDLRWYVDTSLQLLEIAGDFVAEDVWHRIIQVVTNNEELQSYTAQRCFELLQEPIIFEPLLRVSGYILGEFGYMLDASGEDQFAAIHQHFHASDLTTQSMLLTSYMKFGNYYENLIAEVTKIFESFEQSENPELQQRAVEYKTMANYEDQEFIKEVWDSMPDFPDSFGFKKRIEEADKRHAGTTIGNTTTRGGQDESEENDNSSYDTEEDDEDVEEVVRPTKTGTLRPKPVAVEQTDLLGLGNMISTTQSNKTTPSGPGGDLLSSLTKTSNISAAPMVENKISPLDALVSGQGLIYSDNNFAFQMKVQKHLHEGTINIILKQTKPFNGKIHIQSVVGSEEECLVKFQPNTPVDLTDAQLYCKIRCLKPYHKYPTLFTTVTTPDGISRPLNFSIPIDSSSFCKPEKITAQQYTEKAQAFPQGEVQKTVPAPPSLNEEKLRKILCAMGQAIIPFPTSGNLIEVFGHGIFQVLMRGNQLINMNVLHRMEYAPSHQQVRITVRSGSESLNARIMDSCIRFINLQ